MQARGAREALAGSLRGRQGGTLAGYTPISAHLTLRELLMKPLLQALPVTRASACLGWR